MKFHILTALSLSLALQAGVQAQPRQGQPSIEVQIQRLPSYDEGNFYDNSGIPPQSYMNGQDDRGYKGPNRQSNWQNGQAQPTHPMDPNQTMQGNPRSRMMDQQGQQKPLEISNMTLSIIKPDAVQNQHIGEIISRFEKSGLRIAAVKMVRLNKGQSARFYQEHRDRPFFRDLVDYMSSGPVVILVLEGDNAVAKNRELMGATDPKKADKGTLRADFGESMSQNAVHGSDSPESANKEIFFFFRPQDIAPRQ